MWCVGEIRGVESAGRLPFLHPAANTGSGTCDVGPTVCRNSSLSLSRVTPARVPRCRRCNLSLVIRQTIYGIHSLTLLSARPVPCNRGRLSGCDRFLSGWESLERAAAAGVGAIINCR